MSQLPFRNVSPKRSFLKKYTSYRQYKEPLSLDFNRRCGYSDCADRWFGGKNTFHIDHFKPHKKFPALAAEYSNLVYACSYINILKSDDDPINYLDPCDDNYNDHFYRDASGAIHPLSSSGQANYMHKKLKLGLARYRVIWMLDQLYSAMENLGSAIEKTANSDDDKNKMNDLQARLTKEFIKYFNYLNT